ncbi:MAG: quinone-dependent dihydroorotate dehydrogenase [bacterium]
MPGPLYRIARPFLFLLPPETAHTAAGLALRSAARTPGLRDLLRRRNFVHHPALESEVLGLRFPNPVGIAAGWDKDASLLLGTPLLGMGFTEVGTVTPRPQPGNPRPRLFRIPSRRALINRMGFNNQGAGEMARRLSRLDRLGPRPIPVGINIGKNRGTPLREAAEDYTTCVDRLHRWADYFVVNVSSPNTPGLRDLQAPGLLGSLLAEVIPRVEAHNRERGRPPVPVLVKLAPDLDEEGLAATVRAALGAGAGGLVVCNTTRSREGLPPRWQEEEGGLSGVPLRDRSTETIRTVRRLTGGDLPIIGVGGVFSAADAWEKIRAGASLVQVYTGLVYEGPGMARRINRGLLRIMEREGFARLGDVVGSGEGG